METGIPVVAMGWGKGEVKTRYTMGMGGLFG